MESMKSEFKGLENFAISLASLPGIMATTQSSKTLSPKNLDTEESLKKSANN